MFSLFDVGLRRELESILTIYLSLLLQGYSSGFSAVAVPGMKDEMERRWRLERLINNYIASLVILLAAIIPTPTSRPLKPQKRTYLGLVIKMTQYVRLFLKLLIFPASSVNIGQMFGCLLGGYCGGRFGPKRTILASCLPAALGWIIIASSPHYAPLILGRVICGLGSSFFSSNCSLLVAQFRSELR